MRTRGDQAGDEQTENTNVAIFYVLLARSIFDAPFLQLEVAAGLSQQLSLHAMHMLQEGQQQ